MARSEWIGAARKKVRVDDSQPEVSVGRRASVVLVALGIVFLGLSVRLFDVQIAAHEAYVQRRDGQATRTVEIRHPRGTLYDRRGEVLAVSVPVPSIYAVPRKVKDPAALSRAVGFDVTAKLRPDRHFVWIKRLATDEEVARVKGIAGVDVRYEFMRRYPHGSTLSHVLGMTDVDDGGLEGLERALDRFVAGRVVREQVEVDGAAPVPAKRSYPEQKAYGADVELTVDLHLQRIVEEELDGAVARHRPKWAAALVMDPKTGAILALANRPTFDPNGRKGDAAARRNYAVIAPFEPGSTWKPFCVAGALEDGLVTPASRIDCEMGLWKHGKRKLSDHHGYGTLTVRDVVAKSSNIGVAKIAALMMGKDRLWTWATAFGFGQTTGVELPGEDQGVLRPVSRWSEYSITSIPMGHEISVTLLQLVTAMGAIANGGHLMRPYIVARVTDESGAALVVGEPNVVRTVISPKTCEQMRDILAEVVKTGTGQKAAVPGVQVAGKTGTTQKVGTPEGRYISSFVGFAPAENAELCLAVVLDEPQGEYYGGTVAAPVVGNIVRRGLVHAK